MWPANDYLSRDVLREMKIRPPRIDNWEWVDAGVAATIKHANRQHETTDTKLFWMGCHAT